MSVDLDGVFKKLLSAVTNEALTKVLAEIGDDSAVGLDEPFGPFNLFWHPYGDNPSNISAIGLGTKPGRSLTERLTNAMDAVLEDRLPIDVPPPRSPEVAAKQWFGRPVSGPGDGLFRWPFSDADYDRRIFVVINPSGSEYAPTIDVVDYGIGLTPAEFPATILSLHQKNKIQKWYLIGAFGQGGLHFRLLRLCPGLRLVEAAPVFHSLLGYSSRQTR